MPGRHECAIFSSRENEAAESCDSYKNCKKNSGHENFISAQDFKDNYLPRLQSDVRRKMFRSKIDITVRLRVNCTSRGRPDGYPMAEDRGIRKMRVGTGSVWCVEYPKYSEPCVCPKCHGNVARKQWRFRVQTAQHVVFTTEEAKTTQIDFFYDDDSCKSDGRMKSAWGVEVKWSEPDKDFCYMECVTCNEDLGVMIEKFDSCWLNGGELDRQDLSQLGLLPSGGEGCVPALTVSHPHGQPKIITVGVETHRDKETDRVGYNTPTCPGSSGAKVFACDRLWWLLLVHSKTVKNHKLNVFQRWLTKMRGHETEQEQINYGYKL
ncbi:hypothetical protein ElyMa_000759900 [Elysia marginata]|uniref:Uncharacterized protein n=1 Tax=Elysia marginata TaxID=1093978 RepID=A0AAV4GRT1_9GAST|nr:hypothetical protein ElyMa_000759900 [Elysia marginata]